MSTITATAVRVNLERACHDAGCEALADRLHAQLSNGYSWPASLLQLPEQIEDWDAAHRTARKRAAACLRNGYVFEEIDRRPFADDVYAINTSAKKRQGRPMTDGYLRPPAYSALPHYPCSRHAVHTYGVLDSEGRLRAYTWTYRAGELVMFSMILGHAEHLARHVMYLLVRGALAAQIKDGPGFGFYNLDSSGTDGLRFFKHRCGFLPARVDWRLS